MRLAVVVSQGTLDLEAICLFENHFTLYKLFIYGNNAQVRKVLTR